MTFSRSIPVNAGLLRALRHTAINDFSRAERLLYWEERLDDGTTLFSLEMYDGSIRILTVAGTLANILAEGDSPEVQEVEDGEE